MNAALYIEHLLKSAFEPQILEIRDDSAGHAGHLEAGADGQTHFSVVIISEKFAGLSRVQRHQAVYKTLAPLMNTPIHALALKTYTMAEYVK